MKRYSILRNNTELGPYTVWDLKHMPLLATDLVWVEGESTCWRYPEEFEELKAFLAAGPQNAAPHQSKTAEAETKEKIPLLSAYTPVAAARETAETKPQTSPAGHNSFEELKKKYEEKAPKRKPVFKTAGVGAGLFGLLILVIGVLMIAVMVKNAIGHFNAQPIAATAEAHEIINENLSENNMAHTALARTLPATTQRADAVPVPDGQVNAETATTTATATASNLQTEGVNYALNTNEENLAAANKKENPGLKANSESATIPVNKAATKTVDRPDKNDKKPADNATEIKANPAAGTEQATSNKQDEDLHPEKKARAESEAPDARLQVSANNYKVGLFGGISNLELTVKNPSPKPIDKALIEVEYLKPNGSVAHTETVEVSGIAAGASKTVSAPKSSRGVSVRYHIANR